MGSRVIERAVLVILVVVVALETYFAYSAYTIVQAQAAKITAVEARIEREVGAIKAETEARVKRVEDEFARIRRP